MPNLYLTFCFCNLYYGLAKNVPLTRFLYAVHRQGCQIRDGYKEKRFSVLAMFVSSCFSNTCDFCIFQDCPIIADKSGNLARKDRNCWDTPTRLNLCSTFVAHYLAASISIFQLRCLFWSEVVARFLLGQ